MKTLLFCFVLLSTSSVFSQVLLYDNFQNNNNNWPIAKTDTSEFKISEGLYSINKEYESIYHHTKEIPVSENDNFLVEVDLSWFNGVDNYGYGIMMNNNPYHEYTFTITNTGYYRVGCYYHGRSLYQPWKHSPLLKSYTSNNLKVIKYNSWLLYYLNDKLVETTPYRGMPFKRAGIVVYNKQHIKVHKVNIKKLTLEDEEFIFGKKYTSVSAVKTYKKENLGFYFKDEFNDDTYNWNSEEEGKFKAVIKNGKLNFYSKDKRYYAKYLPLNESDFVISLKTKFISDGDGSNSYYGLIWGAHNYENKCAFMISQNGDYVIRFDGFDKSEITAPSKAINLSNENILKVVKSGEVYNFYINDVLVKSLPFKVLLGDKAGVILEDGLTIDFDDLTLQQNILYNKRKPYDKIAGMELLKNNVWHMNSDAVTSRFVGNDLYLSHKSKNGINYSSGCYLEDNSDFSISAQFRVVNVGADNPSWGFVIGHLDWKNYSEFTINNKGQYYIRDICNDNSLTDGWVKSKYVKTEGSNNLRVEKLGNHMCYYINDNLVQVMPFSKIHDYDFGIMMYGDVEVEIKNFEIYENIPEIPPFNQENNVIMSDYSNSSALFTKGKLDETYKKLRLNPLNGKYVVSSVYDKTKLQAFYHDMKILPSNYYKLETVVSWDGVSKDNIPYGGLSFAGKEFVINPKGYRIDSKKYQYETNDITKTSNIFKLKVEFNSNTYYYYLNDKLLTSETAYTYDNGLGLVFYGDNFETKLNFHNLKLVK